MPVVASLAAALVGAVCYGVASVMQAMAVRAASRRAAPGFPAGDGAAVTGGQHSGRGVDPGLLVRMLGQWRFVASLGLDGLGFVAQLVALRRLPLFAVQAILAADLAVTAVCAAWLIGAVLKRQEWLSVAGVVIGIAMLGSSAGPEGVVHPGTTFKLVLIVSVAALTVAGLAAGKLPDTVRTPVLGVIAGLGFGVLAVAARVLPGFGLFTLVGDPATYALVAAAISAFFFYTAALESGGVTAATAAMVLAETLAPAAVGVLFLGDRTRHGLLPVAVAGFVLAVLGAVALARFGEAHHDDTGSARRQAVDPGWGGAENGRSAACS